MLISNLYAKLQLNPRAQAIYVKLVEYYESIGMLNEAEAYRELIRKKFNGYNTPVDKEQRQNNK